MIHGYLSLKWIRCILFISRPRRGAGMDEDKLQHLRAMDAVDIHVMPLRQFWLAMAYEKWTGDYSEFCPSDEKVNCKFVWQIITFLSDFCS